VFMLREVVTYKKFYILSDSIAAIVVWSLFYIYRKVFVESYIFGYPIPLHMGLKFLISILLIPAFWLVIYYFTGYYNNILRKTRLEDFINTLIHSLIGVSFLFFIVILDDTIATYKTYYQSLTVLFLLQFSIVLAVRLLITSSLIRKKKQGKIRFPTLFVGGGEMVYQLWNELNTTYTGHGHDVKGYVSVNGDNRMAFPAMANLGSVNNIHDIIKNQNIEDVIIVLNESEGNILKMVMKSLNTSDVSVKVNPELYPLVKGNINVSSLFQYPLIQVNNYLLSPWQVGVKKGIDIFLSIFGLILALPVCLILVGLIKFTSKGPVLYSHERIGRFGKPFYLYKFRSMYRNAEDNGPQLATKNDPRMTSIGKFMRRLRLDEIPNLINVLKGDMSLVGPRPERKFYIDQIIDVAPEYKQLLKVKPGVTSWGQVKYGYAENVNEMVRRMRYDLLYIENMSIYVDIQILARTIITIFEGKGV
jgi:exopolysaccharide biosynthesis polyprenyl glycosylphosphotransferase